jgi:streptogrisin C
MIAAAALALLIPLAPIVGGDSFFYNGTRCVVGYNAKTMAGEHRILVSGRCTGSSYQTSVLTPPAGATSTPLVRGPNGTTITVAGAQSAPVGASVCRSGPTTGWRCGTVLAKNVTVYYSGGVIYGLTRTSLCSEPGDEGGPIMWNGHAQGLVVGASGNCSSGGTTYFQPVQQVLSAHGLTLHTG